MYLRTGAVSIMSSLGCILLCTPDLWSRRRATYVFSVMSAGRESASSKAPTTCLAVPELQPPRHDHSAQFRQRIEIRTYRPCALKFQGLRDDHRGVLELSCPRHEGIENQVCTETILQTHAVEPLKQTHPSSNRRVIPSRRTQKGIGLAPRKF